MEEFDKVYLAWRNGEGSKRHLVGLLERQSDGHHTFKYLPEAKELVFTEGFFPYFEFQDLNKTYHENVLAIFSHRLAKPERRDIHVLYDFWEVNPAFADDKFYMLGKTEGLSTIDNFEFLAEYKLSKDTHFVTDLAGLSVKKHPKGTISIGDELRVEPEPHNEYDKDAVKVFKGALEVGYIKKVHCTVFQQPGAEHLKLRVKDMEQNGVIRKLFVEVKFAETHSLVTA